MRRDLERQRYRDTHIRAGAANGIRFRRDDDYVRDVDAALGFDTIKASTWLAPRRTVRGSLPSVKTSTRLLPCRGLENYRNSEAIHAAIASRVSETDNFTDSLKTGFIQYHLLSVESTKSPNGLLVVFVSRRNFAPASCVGDVQPRKKALPVYMGVA